MPVLDPVGALGSLGNLAGQLAVLLNDIGRRCESCFRFRLAAPASPPLPGRFLRYRPERHGIVLVRGRFLRYRPERHGIVLVRGRFLRYRPERHGIVLVCLRFLRYRPEGHGIVLVRLRFLRYRPEGHSIVLWPVLFIPGCRDTSSSPSCPGVSSIGAGTTSAVNDPCGAGIPLPDSSTNHWMVQEDATSNRKSGELREHAAFPRGYRE